MDSQFQSSPSSGGNKPAGGGGDKNKFGIWMKFFLITFALLSCIVIWSLLDTWLAQFPFLIIVRRILPFAIGAVVAYTLFVSLTQAPYSAIPLFLLSAYCALVTIENYYLALDPGSTDFVPKLFLDTGVNAGNWLTKLGEIIQNKPQQFFLAAFIALAAQFLQSSIIRDMTGFFDKQKNVITSGDINKVGKGSGLILLTMFSYVVDIGTSLAQYPLWGVAATTWFIHLCWNFISIVGFELLYDKGKEILEKHGML